MNSRSATQPALTSSPAPATTPVSASAASSDNGPLLDVFERMGMTVALGDGVTVEDSTGRRYVDFYGGHAVASLGYGHRRLLDALTGQAHRLFFQSNAVDLEVRTRAAAQLVKLAPRGLTKVFFVNSGAEANENALRIAFLVTKRPKVVAVSGAFHGRTAAAAAITDHHESWYAFPRAPFDVTWVPFDDVVALRAAVDRDTAAVIFEPVQGVAGARALSREFVQAARAAATQAGALLILDEVQIGVGRSGHGFAADHYGVLPDVLTTAKGIAGGFPCGALLVGDALAAQLKKGQLGTTFGGGPLACALVEATLQAIEEDRVLERVRRVSQRIFESCRAGPVESIQGLGLLIGLKCTRPAKEILAELRQRGILAGSSHDPRVVRLLPPLVIEEAQVAQLSAALKEIAR